MLTMHRRHRLLRGQNEQCRVGAALAPEGEADGEAGALGSGPRLGWDGRAGVATGHTSSQQSREGMSSPSQSPRGHAALVGSGMRVSGSDARTPGASSEEVEQVPLLAQRRPQMPALSCRLAQL